MLTIQHVSIFQICQRQAFESYVRQFSSTISEHKFKDTRYITAERSAMTSALQEAITACIGR